MTVAPSPPRSAISIEVLEHLTEPTRVRPDGAVGPDRDVGPRRVDCAPPLRGGDPEVDRFEHVVDAGAINNADAVSASI